mgnify:CR=1 FL=1
MGFFLDDGRPIFQQIAELLRTISSNSANPKGRKSLQPISSLRFTKSTRRLRQKESTSS